MKKTTKRLSRKVAEKLKSKLADSQSRKGANSQISRSANPQISKSPVPPNTLITFPQYLKIPIRFWTNNVGHEIRSSFDLELYAKVCEARGMESGVRVEY